MTKTMSTADYDAFLSGAYPMSQKRALRKAVQDGTTVLQYPKPKRGKRGESEGGDQPIQPSEEIE